MQQLNQWLRNRKKFLTVVLLTMLQYEVGVLSGFLTVVLLSPVHPAFDFLKVSAVALILCLVVEIMYNAERRISPFHRFAYTVVSTYIFR